MKTIFFSLYILFFCTATSLFSQQQKNTPKHIKNEIIVRMQKGTSPYLLERLSPENFTIKVEKALSAHSDIWLLKFNPDKIALENLLSVLDKQNGVLYAQPNRIVELRAAPNDPLYGNQWQHQVIDSELAWDITTGGTTQNGTEIVVALIESADLRNHADLKDNHWINTAEIPGNGIDDDGNGYVDDYNGWNVSTGNDDIGAGSHGTSCAGMIGAKGDNGTGVAGINWNIKIMNVAGHDSPFTEANIVESYDYALQARLLWNQTNGNKGVFVVATSSSWGIDGANPNDYPIWCSFYDDLGQAGILNAGATTNSNFNVDQVGDVPSACASDYMVSVTATNQSDIIDFAGYGANTIDVAAPGSNIYTTAPNSGYTYTSGTSFATPLTAGLIGLLYSVPCPNLEIMAKNNPQSAADLVRQVLFDGVDQSSYLQQRTVTGGRINAKNSIDLLMDQICNSCIIPTDVTTSSTQENTSQISFTGNSNSTDYKVYLREIGTSNWTSFSTSNTHYTFTNLNDCTEYEYYVTSICEEGTESNASNIVTFRTMGCGNCIDLEFCASRADNPAVRFSINSPANLQGNYSFTPTSFFGGDVSNGYVYGELVLVNDGTSSEEGCNTLTNASDINGNIAIVRRGTCPFTDKVMNAQNAGATAVIVVNNVNSAPIEMAGTNGNITIPAVMISRSDGNAIISSINDGNQPMALLGKQDEWISSFSINGNEIVSNAHSGYLMKDSSISLNIGSNYSFLLSPGFSGQPLPENVRIWIDLNQDGIFDNNEILYQQKTASIGAINGSFTIPSNAQSGSSRMRVQLAYQPTNTTSLPDVCGDFNSGEVVDFCVEISGVSGNSEISLSENEQIISIYPNPSNGAINIDNRLGEISKIKIYSPLGQFIQSIKLDAELVYTEIASLSNGIYYFHCIDKNGKLALVRKISFISEK